MQMNIHAETGNLKRKTGVYLVLTTFVVNAGRLSVVKPLLQNRAQFTRIFVAQLQILEPTDRRLAEDRAVNLSQRVSCGE